MTGHLFDLNATEVCSIFTVLLSGLSSNNLDAASATSTIIGNLSKNIDTHHMMIEDGLLDQICLVAKTPHTFRSAHQRRECLRALTNLSATYAEKLSVHGVCAIMEAVKLEVTDPDMLGSATHALSSLS